MNLEETSEKFMNDSMDFLEKSMEYIFNAFSKNSQDEPLAKFLKDFIEDNIISLD